MTRTSTKPLDDRQKWRNVLARLHPDASGSHEAFIFSQAVRDKICSGRVITAEHYPPRPEPGPEPPPKPRPKMVHEEGRVPFPDPADFEALTAQALGTAAFDVPPPYADLLRLLAGCESVDYEPLRGQQQRGATYKQLAAIAHQV